MVGNVIVGQSGGPTSVINSSLAGVVKTARDRGAQKVYGMLHGIKGLLDGQYVDLSVKINSDMSIDLLKRTPSSYLGSCRYKLPEVNEDQAVFEKIFKTLDELDVKYFFYIGGNDSMDTIKKLSDYAAIVNSDIKFMGVPKTIDNDLAVTDHTPGYGSAAKYIAATMKEIIAISEGIKVADGRYVFELSDHVEFVDAFGHKQLSGSAKFLANKIASELGIKARAIELSTMQRCAAHMTSRTDITEAFNVGGAAVKAAFEGETGQVVVLKRISDDPYMCITETHDVHDIANVEKKIPLEWITDDDYVTEDLIHYMRPLIQAELSPIMVDGLPRHLNVNF